MDYTICVDNGYFFTVSGDEAAYAAWQSACNLTAAFGITVSLIDNTTDEIIATNAEDTYPAVYQIDYVINEDNVFAGKGATCYDLQVAYLKINEIKEQYGENLVMLKLITKTRIV